MRVKFVANFVFLTVGCDTLPSHLKYSKLKNDRDPSLRYLAYDNGGTLVVVHNSCFQKLTTGG